MDCLRLAWINFLKIYYLGGFPAIRSFSLLQVAFLLIAASLAWGDRANWKVVRRKKDWGTEESVQLKCLACSHEQKKRREPEAATLSLGCAITRHFQVRLLANYCGNCNGTSMDGNCTCIRQSDIFSAEASEIRKPFVTAPTTARNVVDGHGV